MRDLWCAVIEDEEFRALKDDATRKRQSRKARSFLLFYISQKLRESVIGATTAKELWDLLKNRFNKHSDDRTATLHQQLTSASQRPGERMAEYLSRLEGIVRELKESCNEKVSDGMLVGILLNGVSPVYNETIAALRCLDALKLDTLKQKLIAAEDRLSDSKRQVSEKSKAQAFASRGENAMQAPRRPGDEVPRRRKPPRYRCWNCGQGGHMSATCPNRNPAAANGQPPNRNAVALMTRNHESHVHSPECAHALLIDTGASHHIISDLGCFVKVHNSPVSTVSCGGGEKHVVLHAGTAVVQGDHGMVQLLDALFVPTFKVNLISGSAACSNGAKLEASGTTLHVVVESRTVLMADNVGGLFHVRGHVLHIKDVPGSFTHAASAETWYKRLGHVSYDVMKHLQRHTAAVHFDVQGAITAPREPCGICLGGKHERAPFPTSTSCTSKPLELVHADVIGKMPCESLGGSQYILTVLDDYTGLSAVACVRRKSAVGEEFKDILATWARQSGCLVKKVRTDGGSEFLADFAACLRNKGIIHERSVRYTPQQNGAAERLNRTLMERSRCMLLDAGLKRWLQLVMFAT
jgi:hypothetical protein